MENAESARTALECLKAALLFLHRKLEAKLYTKMQSGNEISEKGSDRLMCRREVNLIQEYIAHNLNTRRKEIIIIHITICWLKEK